MLNIELIHHECYSRMVNLRHLDHSFITQLKHHCRYMLFILMSDAIGNLMIVLKFKCLYPLCIYSCIVFNIAKYFLDCLYLVICISN